MSKAAYIKIERMRGDRDPISLTLQRGADPIGLSGCTVVMTVDTRKDPDDTSTQVFQLAGTITDADAGEVEFQQSVAEAATTPGHYYVDVQVTDSSTIPVTPGKGDFIIYQDISK